ncbi:unnamed protein product [Polarella glacialis]|uniref:Uncharacterized protein n=1 Tax=Polarella glacialis TaxID=89957 RepID=A0A813IWW5_POLGL|nr:unnamed protein product [Polarella glacialis]
MGDDPSPTQEEEVCEVEVEVQSDPASLDIGVEGFAETFLDLVEEPSPERAEGEYQADYLDLTGPGEDPPDWGPQEGEEADEALALEDRPPRTRGSRSGAKVQRQRVTRTAAIARSVIAEAAAEARRANQPTAAPREARATSSASASATAAASSSGGAGARRGPTQAAPRHQGVATARGRSIPAACATPCAAPQLLTREQTELRHASRSRSAASDRYETDRPRRPSSRRREPSQARGQRRPESRPVYTERVDSDYLSQRLRY